MGSYLLNKQASRGAGLFSDPSWAKRFFLCCRSSWPLSSSCLRLPSITGPQDTEVVEEEVEEEEEEEEETDDFGRELDLGVESVDCSCKAEGSYRP